MVNKLDPIDYDVQIKGLYMHELKNNFMRVMICILIDVVSIKCIKSVSRIKINRKKLLAEHQKKMSPTEDGVKVDD